MDNRPELYELETIEQLRAVADPLRLRIIDRISDRAMTVTQVGEALDVPANKIHYHVRELERVGLVRIVETREKGGILEKYYQTVARGLSAPKSLLSRAAPEDSIAVATEVLQSVVHNFMAAFAHVVRTEDWDTAAINLTITELWMTPDELVETVGRFREILKPFQDPRRAGETSPVSLLLLTHPSVSERVTGAHEAGSDRSRPDDRARRGPDRRDDDATPPGTGNNLPEGSGRRREAAKPHLVVVAGSVSYSRSELERVIAGGRQLDLSVLGSLSFAADVSAELVDRAIVRLRHRGALNASSEVKAVIERKGAKVST